MENLLENVKKKKQKFRVYIFLLIKKKKSRENKVTCLKGFGGLIEASMQEQKKYSRLDF